MSLWSLPPEEALSIILSERDVVLHTAAAGAFTFWEYCLTFSQEVNLVWKPRRSWGVINCLFVFIRYVTIFCRAIQLLFYTNIAGVIHPSRTACQNWVKVEIIAGHVMLLAVDILLAMRTYAFYGQDRKILILLAGIILAGQVASITIIIVTISGFVAIPSPEQTLNIGACIVIRADPRFPNYLLPTAVVESCLTLLITLKFIYNKVKTKGPTSPTLMVFIRDGAWAFALVFAGLLWIVVTYSTSPVKGDVPLTWLFPILSLCGTRLILNLRSEVAGKNMFSQLDTGVSTLLHFHSPGFACPCELRRVPDVQSTGIE